MENNIPIYIISFNRLTCLKTSIKSYLKFLKFEDIIILDQGSDYPPLLDYYKELSSLGCEVRYFEKINHASELNKLGHYIEIENKKRHANYYIVTDPDVEFLNTDSDILNIYVSLLNKLEVAVVGPMLTIHDIPEQYALREYAWLRHVEQFWRKNPKSISIFDKQVFYQYAKIDTTFGIYNVSTSWERGLSGIRVYNPYEARHLDWYYDSDYLPPDQKYYCNTVKLNRITHWNESGVNSRKIVLPNYMRYIKLIENNRIKTRKLPNNKAYHKMLIPSISIPFNRIINFLIKS